MDGANTVTLNDRVFVQHDLLCWVLEHIDNPHVLVRRPETVQLIPLARRAFLRRLEGGCQVPIACHGTIDGDQLTLNGFVSDVEGVRCLKKKVTGPAVDCEKLGTSLADDLLIQGAGEILNEVYNSETFNVEKEDV